MRIILILMSLCLSTPVWAQSTQSWNPWDSVRKGQEAADSMHRAWQGGQPVPYSYPSPYSQVMPQPQTNVQDEQLKLLWQQYLSQQILQQYEQRPHHSR